MTLGTTGAAAASCSVTPAAGSLAASRAWPGEAGGRDGADATASRPFAADAPAITNAASPPPARSACPQITGSMPSNAS